MKRNNASVLLAMIIAMALIMPLAAADSLTVEEVDDGVIIETARVKYHLANGGFAKELWVDHDGDGTYDEDLSFYLEHQCDNPHWDRELGFGCWNLQNIYPTGGAYGGSVCNGIYSKEILETSDEKVAVVFSGDFPFVTSKTKRLSHNCF